MQSSTAELATSLPTLSRRSFVSRGSLGLVGSAFLPSIVEASAAFGTSHSTVRLPLSTADQTVLRWVRSYASAVRLVGSGVLGKMRDSSQAKIHILAEVEDLSLLRGTLASRLPYGDALIHTEGNTFSIDFSGTSFTIEYLLPDAFDAALAARRSRATTVFATDSLMWDPSSNGLEDPFGAAHGNSLKLIHPGVGAAAVFATMLRSYSEADSANLDFDVSFRAYRQRAMSLSGAGGGSAEAIVDELIRRLPELADTRTTQEVVSILSSHLVSSSLHRHLGIVARVVTSQFAGLRPHTPASISDAAIWLALIMAPQIRLGTATAWAAELEPSRRARFVAALTEAQALVTA